LLKFHLFTAAFWGACRPFSRNIVTLMAL
jgi:hypothetical protein